MAIKTRRLCLAGSFAVLTILAVARGTRSSRASLRTGRWLDDHGQGTSTPLLAKSRRQLNGDDAAGSSVTLTTTTENEVRGRPLSSTQNTTNKTFEHVFLHIPRTGGTYAVSMIQKLLLKSWNPQQQHPNQDDNLSSGGLMCTVSSDDLDEASENAAAPDLADNDDCLLSTTSNPHVHSSISLAHNKYTIIRDPREHILSLYFDCTGQSSNDYSGSEEIEDVPSLDDWLTAWVQNLEEKRQQQQNENNETEPTMTPTATHTLSFNYDPTIREDASSQSLLKLYQECRYNPTNLQSYMTQFSARAFLPNTQNNYHNDEKLVKRQENALSDLFTVLGDNSQMTKTICMIVIHITDAVPQECDCTSINNQGKSSTSSSSMRRQFWTKRDSVKYNDRSGLTSTAQDEVQAEKDDATRRVARHHDDYRYYASTFQTTESEDAMIAKLTEYDRVLYDLTRQVFANQVHQIESEYQIQLCD